MARPKKVNDDLLLEIIKKYLEDNIYITKLKFSDLVEHANNMGYTNIKYTDFYRSKSINEFIEKFNEQRTKSSLRKTDGDELHYYNFLVEDIVEKYHKDKVQLKAILNIFKESYDKTFKELSKLQSKIDKSQSENQELKNILKNANEKNKTLKIENDELKRKIRDNKKDEKSRCMLEGIKYLADTKNIVISDESDIMNIMKNFKNANAYESDVIDVEQLLSETVKQKKVVKNGFQDTNKEDKIIHLSNKKEGLKLPDLLKK